MKQKIIDALIEIEAIKFGKFKLKSGIISPIYIDLRIIVSYPQMLKNIAQGLMGLAESIEYDSIAGIPYTALPIATAYSLESGKPMIYARKEKKEYGTAQQIEGIWKKGDTVLIIDDLITDGASKSETFEVFESAGLVVNDIVILIDREQGGKENIQKTGHCVHSLISIFEVLDRIKSLNKLDKQRYNEILAFLNKKVK
ncbi:MAG: orotate phosphoribosyltransferase [Deltaproteobacteria bacterium]|jgi:uridine monophosphate synthetase|nr:orotate phosphoribosyltransferase [Deltaproteobacteria bacterium]